MEQLWLYLGLILFIGIITTYTDIRYNKIKNRDILIGFFLFIILLIIFSGSYTTHDYWLIFLNTFFALLVGFLLFFFDFWNAGDAKLYSLYALIIPLGFYTNNIYGVFPSFSILINTFVPFFIVFSFVSLLKTRKAVSIKLKDMVPISLLFLNGFLFFGLLSLQIPFALSLLLGFTFLFFIRTIFQKYTLIPYLTLLILITISLLLFNYQILSIALLTWPLILFIYFMGRVNSSFVSREVKLGDLKEGMKLTDRISINGKQKVFLHALTSRDLALLKKHFKKNKIFHTDGHFALAPFLFVAILLLLLLGGDIFSSLYAPLS